MSTQSYWIIEAMASDMNGVRQKLAALIEMEESIGDEEQLHLKDLMDTCKEIVQMYEEAVSNGTIDENGKLPFENEGV